MEENYNKEEEKKGTVEEKKDTIKISNKVIWGAVLVLALVVGAFFVFQNKGETGVTANEKPAVVISPDAVAALVNGEEITVGELNSAYDSLPAQYKSSIDKNSLLEELVQTKVIYQEAIKQGVAVSSEEAEQEFEKAKLQSGLTDEQVEATLASQGISVDELVEQYRKQILIQKFLDESFLRGIEISDAEIREFYDANAENFVEQEKVKVRHILIGNSEMTAEQQEQKARELLLEVDKKNFCEYVEEYSTDMASVPNCGEYTFGKGEPFAEEFKTLAFSQDKGEIGVTGTQFGSHIIWTVEKTPARTIKFSEVKKDIEDALRAEEGRKQFQTFYEELAQDSVIEIKFENI